MDESSSFASVLPTSSVELSIRCEKLKNTDILSKSDPFCAVFIRGANTGWVELGRTEKLDDTLCPVWQRKFIVEYKFEERQFLKFCVYDWDRDSKNLDDHDFLGNMECTLGEIVSKQSAGFSKPLLQGQKGIIHVVAEELAGNKEVATFKFSARKLDKMDWFGKSDPYMEIHRSTESNQYILVHRTEFIKKTLDPDWKSFKISLKSLNNGDDDRDLRFDIYDWNSSGNPDLIGSFHTNMRTMRTGPNSFECINKEKQKRKGAKYKNSGTVILNTVRVETVPSFLDFIQGGTQVNFTVAVDFTGSNGNPNFPESLHYKDPTGKPNQYVTAINSVGEIIQDYDSDKLFPALGFGARIPPNGTVSHEFFLTLEPSNPYCHGVEGILAAYYNSLYKVQLYGPTNFSPVISHVAKFAAAYQNDPSNYFVLLIITDGIITDLDETKKSIISASGLPMSIIIVGVGEEDFSAMDELDSDESLLRVGNMIAKRDIVQFVELRKFVRNNYWSKEHLAKEVLAEIPDQLLAHMKNQGFKPENTSSQTASGAPPTAPVS